jgi:hypothetical protein
MLLLIDAYNLLHHSDALGRARGEGWLERARGRLLRRLSQQLGADLAAETCLVFDAAGAPPGADPELRVDGLWVRFAVDHDEADDLLEEMIAAHSAPKRLMVVSSDHRVQRAASRRGARAMDADLWYAALIEGKPQLAIPWPPPEAARDGQRSPTEKPPEPTSQAEREDWIRWFGIDLGATGELAAEEDSPSPEGYGEDLEGDFE